MSDPEGEVKILVEEIERLGEQLESGKYGVKYGVLVRDEDVANKLEALMGTLRSAKKKKVVAYDGEMLWQVCFLETCRPVSFAHKVHVLHTIFHRTGSIFPPNTSASHASDKIRLYMFCL